MVSAKCIRNEPTIEKQIQSTEIDAEISENDETGTFDLKVRLFRNSIVK